MRPFFITATGTELGKTYVTCALIRALRQRSSPVTAFKPVISGFDPAHPEESDTGLLLHALGRTINAPNIAEMSPWRFHAPLSPDMAAEREDRPINVNALVATCASAARPDRVTFIEGAGGLMSPLAPRFTNLDLAAAIDAHILLVAGTYLGTISHTLTACEALAARGREPCAIVLSETPASPVPPAETAQSIARFVDTPIVIVTRNGAAPAELVGMFTR
jgi:dethiobiotin synthetase